MRSVPMPPAPRRGRTRSSTSTGDTCRMFSRESDGAKESSTKRRGDRQRAAAVLLPWRLGTTEPSEQAGSFAGPARLHQIAELLGLAEALKKNLHHRGILQVGPERVLYPLCARDLPNCGVHCDVRPIHSVG